MLRPQQLDVYVSRHCSGCVDAAAIAEACRARDRQVAIEIIDVDREPGRVPNAVVAVPTYVLDGQAIHLGNPSLEWLLQRLAEGREEALGEPPN